jgi:hypothetical protein
MFDERRPDLAAEAGDDIHHARRKACFREQPDELQRRGRSELRWLDHHRAARGECWRDLPCGEQQGRVPRCNRGNYTEWFVARKVEKALFIERNHAAFDLVRQTAEVIEPLRDVVQLSRHFGKQLAVVAHFDCCELVGVACDQVAQAAQQLPALCRAQLRPRAAGERAVRSLNRTIGVAWGALGNLCPRVTGIGVVRLEPALALRRRILAVDVVHVALHVDFLFR